LDSIVVERIVVVNHSHYDTMQWQPNIEHNEQN